MSNLIDKKIDYFFGLNPMTSMVYIISITSWWYKYRNFSYLAC
jgi:hypothetical protein